jgi:hypothetical protein
MTATCGDTTGKALTCADGCPRLSLGFSPSVTSMCPGDSMIGLAMGGSRTLKVSVAEDNSENALHEARRLSPAQLAPMGRGPSLAMGRGTADLAHRSTSTHARSRPHVPSMCPAPGTRFRNGPLGDPAGRSLAPRPSCASVSPHRDPRLSLRRVLVDARQLDSRKHAGAHGLARTRRSVHLAVRPTLRAVAGQAGSIPAGSSSVNAGGA